MSPAISLDGFTESISADGFEETKPAYVPRRHLSNSQISTYTRCPLVYYWRYIKGEKSAPAANMVLGSGVHKALEHNYKQKIISHKDVPVETVMDVFNDYWRRESPDAIFDPEKNETPDSFKEYGLMMVKKYQEEVAPNIQPAHIEKRFMLNIPGIDRGILGFIDLIDTGDIVVDHKTSKATPNALNLAKDFQLVLYKMAFRVMFGREAKGLRYDYLVRKNSKRTGSWCEIHPMPVEKNKIHEMALVNHVKTVLRGIKMAFFHQPDVFSFICTPGGCGFWGKCQGAIQRGNKPEFLDDITEMQVAAKQKLIETGEL